MNDDNKDSNLDNQPGEQPNVTGGAADLTPTPSYEQEPSTAPAAPVPSDQTAAAPVISDIAPPTSSPNIKPDAPLAGSPSLDISSPISGPLGDGLGQTGPVEPVSAAPLGDAAINTIPVDQTTANSVDPANTLAFPAKKKKGGLIAMIIILVVLLAGLAGGYFYFKSSADSAASDYRGAAKTYLTGIESAAVNLEADPVLAGQAIQAVSKPALNTVMLDFLSSKYNDASVLEVDVNKKVEALMSKVGDIERLASLQKFSVDYTELAKQGETILAGFASASDDEAKKAVYQSYVTHLQALDTLVNEAVLPASADSIQLDLSTAIQKEIGIYQGRIESGQLTDEEAELTAALADRKTAVDALTAQAGAAQETISSLTQEALAALEDLSNLASTL